VSGSDSLRIIHPTGAIDRRQQDEQDRHERGGAARNADGGRLAGAQAAGAPSLQGRNRIVRDRLHGYGDACLRMHQQRLVTHSDQRGAKPLAVPQAHVQLRAHLDLRGERPPHVAPGAGRGPGPHVRVFPRRVAANRTARRTSSGPSPDPSSPRLPASRPSHRFGQHLRGHPASRARSDDADIKRFPASDDFHAAILIACAPAAPASSRGVVNRPYD
jgi:hypothetical protein